MSTVSPQRKDQIVKKYIDTMKRMLHLSFPQLQSHELEAAILYSIDKRYKEEPAKIYNNYKKKTVNMTLYEIVNYIMEREPIMTASGVLFTQHGKTINPLAKLFKTFLDKREEDKAMMFSFPPGSEEYEKYDLFQLLDKLDANGLYGALGSATCLFFNVYVASSITSQARSSISAATLQFEMFLNNSVKFGSLNDAITYIDNIRQERPNRKYKDSDILDRNITPQECWGQLAKTCGYEWVPTEDDLVILWNIVNQLDQEDLNRLYYKNNLYSFMNNESMTKAITIILKKLEAPFLDPNHPPKEILAELEELLSLFKEYVYYSHQIIDRIDRMTNMIKSVTMISDTDSAIINLDGWYRFILDKIRGQKMKIAMEYYQPLVPVEKDEFGDFSKLTSIDMLDDDVELDYDFYSDEIRELERSINPLTVVPQEGVRYSIINIIAYCLTDIVNDYMAKYCELNHSNINNPSKKCRLYLKNEFLFKSALLTWVKKHYATIQELREGHFNNNKLDIKGLDINKTTLNKSVQEEMKNIIYEDILNCNDIDQVKILKHLAILEKKIYDSVHSGSKDFFKPVSIKPANKYDNPMGQQGIKASVVWNKIKDEGLIGINLEERNNIDIAKVQINRANVEKIKDTYPETYSKIISCMEDTFFKNGIEAVAIPRNVDVPDWLTEFVDVNTIANDNMSAFPFESIGLTRMNGVKNNNVNFTNILSL